VDQRLSGVGNRCGQRELGEAAQTAVIVFAESDEAECLEYAVSGVAERLKHRGEALHAAGGNAEFDFDVITGKQSASEAEQATVGGDRSKPALSAFSVFSGQADGQ